MRKVPAIALAVLLAASGASASAAETQDVTVLRNTMRNLIELLVQEGVLTRARADTLIQQAESQAARQAAPPSPGARDASGQPGAALPTSPPVVRVPYVPEIVKDQIRAQVRAGLRKEVVQDVLADAKRQKWGVPGALPEWLQRIKLNGDIRLREESDFFAGGNVANSIPDFQKVNRSGGFAKTNEPFFNTTEDRQRLRVRMRLGVQALITKRLEAGVRITTGSLRDPVSTNQTLGNFGQGYQLVLDRAYLHYRSAGGHLEAWGGRLPNPWFHTDLVWDPDVNFEGIAATLRPLGALGRGAGAPRFSPYLTLGGFPVQEVALSAHDKWLLGAQGGFDWIVSSATTVHLGAAYYDYENIQAVRDPLNTQLNDFTAPAFIQNGNSMCEISNDSGQTGRLFGLCSDFKEANLTASVDYAGFGLNHLIVTADYVRNIGLNRDAIQREFGALIPRGNEGYQLLVTVGRPRIHKRYDWQLVGAYKRLEANAVLSSFTDSDFHLGGTNAAGWILRGKYGVATNTWLAVSWLSAKEINGIPYGVDVLQVDLNARF